MYRAFPFTIGITAGQATVCLMRGLFGSKLAVDFPVFLFAFISGFFLWVLPGNLNELKVVTHNSSF